MRGPCILSSCAPPQERSEMRDGILQADDKLNAFKTVITSYEIVMRDRRQLQV